MLVPSSSTVLVALSVLSFASQISGERSEQISFQLKGDSEPRPPRIAIVGAGAGGSSSAYHLSKFYNETNDEELEIDIFESNSYIGGRSTTVNVLNDPRYPVELGGSIFVTVNHILYNFTQDFGLSTRDTLYESTGAVYDLGIWDGSDFLFTLANDDSNDSDWKGRWKGYWDIAKLLWRYGLSPIWTQRAKDNVVARFLRMYDEYFPITSLTSFVSEVGLSEYTGITGQAALLKNGVSEKYAREIVQSSTRVNYAQNLNSIHGLETMVCMAIEGAMAIDGGNWQMFSEAIKRSGATVHLNTTVTDIHKTAQNTYQIHTSNTSASTTHSNTREYDTVILASPYQFSNITFTPPITPSLIPEKIDYVTLHVTLFTSPYRPSPSYFNLTSQDLVPDSILTTLPSSLDNTNTGTNTKSKDTSTPRGRAAVGPTRFWSLSTLRVINPRYDPFPPSTSDTELVRASKLTHTTNASDPTAQKQYLYKIFSPEPVTASFLSELFDLNYTHPCPSSPNSQSKDEASDIDTDTNEVKIEDPISNLPRTLVPWHHTKTWHSYPYLPPRTSFSAIKLDGEDVEQFNAQTTTKKKNKISAAHWTGAYGVYYTSGIEAFISTMETSALMGRNVARIIVSGLEAVKEMKMEMKEREE